MYIGYGVHTGVYVPTYNRLQKVFVLKKSLLQYLSDGILFRSVEIILIVFSEHTIY
jgi:hypothetical protein